jgi:hypothetical protein
MFSHHHFHSKKKKKSFDPIPFFSRPNERVNFFLQNVNIIETALKSRYMEEETKHCSILVFNT